MVVRLAFAVQACISPKILIVDEALSVGDEKFQRKCFDYIENLRGNGCSILLVTHSTATVEKFCQRGVLLHKGEIHGIGPAKEIVDQYHALLYSDEQSYLRYVNQNNQQSAEKSSSIPEDLKEIGVVSSEEKANIPVGLRAVIRGWDIFNSAGENSEAFYSGDKADIQFEVNVLQDVGEIQAGILVRTVEGVTVFGTSTLYHGCNHLNAKAGTSIRFDFHLDLSLCPGSYFITLAIAEAISHGDMSYLDRKTDAIIIKVNQIRLMGSGIAMLESHVRVHDLGR